MLIMVRFGLQGCKEAGIPCFGTLWDFVRRSLSPPMHARKTHMHHFPSCLACSDRRSLFVGRSAAPRSRQRSTSTRTTFIPHPVNRWRAVRTWTCISGAPRLYILNVSSSQSHHALLLLIISHISRVYCHSASLLYLVYLCTSSDRRMSNRVLLHESAPVCTGSATLSLRDGFCYRLS